MFDNIKKKIDNMKVEAQKRREEEERLEKEKLVIEVKVGENGKLFGAITN